MSSRNISSSIFRDVQEKQIDASLGIGVSALLLGIILVIYLFAIYWFNLWEHPIGIVARGIRSLYGSSPGNISHYTASTYATYSSSGYATSNGTGTYSAPSFSFYGEETESVIYDEPGREKGKEVEIEKEVQEIDASSESESGQGTYVAPSSSGHSSLSNANSRIARSEDYYSVEY